MSSGNINKGKQSLSTVTQRLEERTAKRAATAEEKKRAAEQFKDEGNVLYRHGKYVEAAKCYEDAILKYGPRAVYLNNLAAALLKLNRHDEALDAASHALKRDPKLLKARFRRGIARRNLGLFRMAIIDFQTVIRQDPDCQEAKDELAETLLMYARLDVSGDSSDELEGAARPLHDCSDDGSDTAFFSDTSDFNHTGNGIPCRFYNHDGCNRGTKCGFKHAPDSRSVRDRLGRNVCLYNILGLCKFTEAKCVYSHDKTYLPPTVWDDPKRVDHDRQALKMCGANHSAQKLESLIPLMNPCKAGPGCLPRNRIKETEEATEAFAYNSIFNTLAGPSRDGTSGLGNGWPGLDYEPDADEVDFGYSYDSDEDEEYSEGDGDDEDGWSDTNDGEFGFSHDDVQELLAQGVKPWDDDAADVLAALRDM